VVLSSERGLADGRSVFEGANRRGEALDLGRSRRLGRDERGREGNPGRGARWVAALAPAGQQQRLRPIQRLPFSTLAPVDLLARIPRLFFTLLPCPTARGPEMTTEFVSVSCSD
jgi:hypothetical protein